MAQPLQGIKVVELAEGIAGPYAGKLLADFGADVVKVEPAAGDAARWWGPFPEGLGPPEGAGRGPGSAPPSASAGMATSPAGAWLEHSATFLHLNTNKRSVVAPDAATVDRLVAAADVVIHSQPPGAFDVAGHQARNPRLVVCSVTPFGQDGPYAGMPADEITLYALGGTLSSTGLERREPVKLGADVGQYQCGGVAALASLAALTVAERSGRGIHVDVANLETQAGSIDRRMTYLLYRAYTGRDAPREAERISPMPVGIYPADDGYLFLACMPAWVPRMLTTVGDGELAARYANPGWVFDPELPELANGAMFAWTLSHGRQDAMETAQANGWAVTALNHPVDVLADPHFAARGFFVDVDHPVAGRIRQPGPPVRMGDGWALRRPAPTLGQHTDSVVAELAASPPRPAAPVAAGPARLPLDGVTVLDLTVVWAGPYVTMLLGDLGAKVIRIDNPWVFPTATRGLLPRPPRELAEGIGPIFGTYPDADPGARPWNRIGLFTAHGRNKANVTLDLRKPLGREMFMQLAERADVVVENNAVGLLDKLGIGWDEVHARNPRLVMVRMPSVGLSGPYRDYIGFGINFETLCGLTAIRGYADMDPSSNGSVYHMDAASGPAGALATLMALRRRERTGAGELVEVAQAENMMSHIGELFVDAARNGTVHATLGNRHRWRAPQGVYPCRPAPADGPARVGDAGPDRWLAISIGSDDEWAALADLIGRADLAPMTADARRAAHDELDDAIAAWTAGRTAADAFARCRQRGVPAGAVHTEADCYADAQLAARGFFRPNGNAELGEHRYPGHCWRWDGPDLAWGPPPLMGGDNEAVYRGLLGLDDVAWQALVDDGHISLDYLAPDGNPL